MSLLSIVQDISREIGVSSVPTVAFGSEDPTVSQVVYFVNRAGKALMKKNWPILRRECLHTTLAAELQGELATIADGYDRMAPDTVFNRSMIHKVGGPLTSQQWQRIKADGITGPYHEFQMKADPATSKMSLYLLPAPSAGQTVAFDYFINTWVAKSDYSELYTEFQADTDESLIPEHVIMLDAVWRWKRRNGLPYAEDFREAEFEIARYLGDQIGSSTIQLSSCMAGEILAPSVPDGNWDL